MYEIFYTKAAVKDIERLKQAQLNKKAKALIDIIRVNPYQYPPSYEKLVVDLQGLYARRINVQHRLVYEVFEDDKKVKILGMWTHYAI